MHARSLGRKVSGLCAKTHRTDASRMTRTFGSRHKACLGRRLYANTARNANHQTRARNAREEPEDVNPGNLKQITQDDLIFPVARSLTKEETLPPPIRGTTTNYSFLQARK